MRKTLLTSLIVWLGLTGYCHAAELEWVRVADDNRSFVLEKSIPTQPSFGSVECEGMYRHHLQGICTNENDAIY